MATLNTEYARLCRDWARLFTLDTRRPLTPSEQADYKRINAEMERIELGWGESRIAGGQQHERHLR